MPCPSNGKKISRIIIIHPFATVHIHLQPSFLMLSVVSLIKEAGSSIKVTKDASNRQLVKFLTSRNCAYNHARVLSFLDLFRSVRNKEEAASLSILPIPEF